MTTIPHRAYEKWRHKYRKEARGASRCMLMLWVVFLIHASSCGHRSLTEQSLALQGRRPAHSERNPESAMFFPEAFAKHFPSLGSEADACKATVLGVSDDN